MANDIKLEGMAPVSAAKPVQKPAARPNNNQMTRENDVTLSPHLSYLVEKLASDSSASTSAERILALRHQIENNEYKVDLDALASKLARTLLTRNPG